MLDEANSSAPVEPVASVPMEPVGAEPFGQSPAPLGPLTVRYDRPELAFNDLSLGGDGSLVRRELKAELPSNPTDGRLRLLPDWRIVYDRDGSRSTVVALDVSTGKFHLGEDPVWNVPAHIHFELRVDGSARITTDLGHVPALDMELRVDASGKVRADHGGGALPSSLSGPASFG